MQNLLLAIAAIVVIVFGIYLVTDTDTDEVDVYTTEDTSMENVATDSMTETTPEDAPSETNMDIVEIASANNNFDTLVSAVTAADLVETLQGPGPFTVFAPTDGAFNDLPAGTLDELLLPENETQLTEILTYHVVSGEVRSTDLMDGMTATTVNGEEITVSVDSSGIMINDATVVTADI